MHIIISAGVGRTGTFIAIDIILEQVKKEKVIDVCGVITKMRNQRMKMVQTAVSVKFEITEYNTCPLSYVPQNQFKFIHDVILESVTCGDTQINSGDLRSTIVQMKRANKNSGKTTFEIQFEVCS